MRALRRIGRDDLAWPLRRLHVPVTSDALVLEVGSGGNPFPRANVLLDAYEQTRERHFQPLVHDRTTVLGLIENMPFRDDSFDFVIACHVVEHSVDIVGCLRELQRVARAGYIETPDAFYERINPYHDHRLELTVRDGELLIHPKRAWRQDEEVVELYEAQVKPSRGWAAQLRKNPFAFHLRYFWSRADGGIRFRVLPGKATEPIATHGEEEATEVRSVVTPRQLAVSAARSLLSQRRRNRSIDLLSLLRCPLCHLPHLRRHRADLVCDACGTAYPFTEQQVARLIPRSAAL